MSFEEFRARLVDPRLVLLADYWQGLRRGRRLPAWKEVDAIAIAPCLPIVWSVRFDPEQDAFIGVLAGEEVIAASGVNFRNKRIDQHADAAVARMLVDRFRRVTFGPALYQSRGKVLASSGRPGMGERIILPLGADGVHGDMLLGATVYKFVTAPSAGERTDMPPQQEQIEYFPID